MNATEVGLLIDRRRLRAIRLTAAIMQAIAPVLDRSEHDGEVDRGRLHDAIAELLSTKGVDTITDMDRASAGLPARDDLGYTADELLAMEARSLDAIKRFVR